MKMSPLTRKALNLASSFLQGVLDVILHQLILSFSLFIFSESLAFEVRVFLSGIIIVCLSFSSLYGFESLRHTFRHEKVSIRRAYILISFLSVMFSFTSEVPASLGVIIFSLALFFAINLSVRYSLRHVLNSGGSEFFRIFGAKAAYAFGESESESRIKASRQNMKAVYAKKSMIYKFIKRTFDVLSSGIALILLSPVLALTALAIKLEDHGPVFYSAKRWGKDMKTFKMVKFRSMRVNADALLKDLLKDSEQTGHAFKIKDDPRITRVGKFIRKYSIDELPQLWNIFTGDMSVVGPRPIMTVNTEEISDYDKQRWIVQPGLTCYWQVSGRADVKWEEWIEMDLDYIERMSMIEDLKLIFKTVPVVFKASGAY